jgi:hypothetical protein
VSDRLPAARHETVNAALDALDNIDWPWWARPLRRREHPLRLRIAGWAARAAEHTTRGLCAEAIGDLGDPAWREALAAAQQAVLGAGGDALGGGWWARLPPFSGIVPGGGCAKCGQGVAASVKHERIQVRAAGRVLAGVRAECLARRCSGCGFEWRERCADAREPEPADEATRNHDEKD